MKIEYAVPCRSIEALADGTYVVIGAEFNAAGPAQFPCPIAPFVLIGVSRAHADNTEGHLAIRVLDPALEVCGPELGINFTIADHPLLPAGWSARMMLPVQIMFNAAQAGGYSIEMSIGNSSTSVPFLVLPAPGG